MSVPNLEDKGAQAKNHPFVTPGGLNMLWISLGIFLGSFLNFQPAKACCPCCRAPKQIGMMIMFDVQLIIRYTDFQSDKPR